MKKAIILSLVIFFAAITSCKKNSDEDILAPEQNPLAGYLAATGFDEKITNQINLGNYEFGISFIPAVNGKITALVVKIPDVNPTLRMTIWNKTASTVLKSEIINYSTAGVEVTKAITPLDVVAGTEYFVTFNSNDWYDHRRNNSTNATYPIVVGDISITSYSFISGSAQAMPNSPS